ncbi:MAG: hypothetical protein IAF94_01195 [Pirellulaceae bacterium]|nr:hypothetical protein [Pirellulaceae bacterium]
MNRCILLPISLVIAVAMQTPLFAADAPLKELLAKPILDAMAVQNEVQAFCDARVPKVPQAASKEEWEKLAAKMRAETLEKVVFRGEAAKWRDAPGKVEWLETVEGGDGYKLKKLRYEALPGLWIPALLYEPEKLDGKHAVFLNVNGHDGKGKAAVYKQTRCINFAKRGIITLNVEWFGMGQLRSAGFSHPMLNQIDLCGSSGLATFYLAMSRGIDLLLKNENADPSRVGVSGLSGGGWQTIIISSLDTRVTLTNPVAGYSSFRTRIFNHSDLGDSEQTPVDLATTADYAHLTAMLAPRVALLTYNQKDECCFAAPHALQPLLDASGPIYKLFGKEENLHSHVNYDPGTHNFEKDNRQALYKVIGQHWYSGNANYSADEIACDKEIKTADQLNVELPADNLDLHQIALRLASGLPQAPPPPKDGKELSAWQVDARKRLAGVIAFHPWEVEAAKINDEVSDGVQVTRWKLKINKEWTVPAVELAPADAKSTVLLIADGGRGAAEEKIKKLLHEKVRVVVLEPYMFGESNIKNRAYLFALLVSAVGERPLGVQTSQVAAAARWLKKEHGGSVRLEAVGPRTSLIALCAAGLEMDSLSGVGTEGELASLKQIIEQNNTVDRTPEQFCFGLLQQFDIPHLKALSTRP